MMPGGDHWLWAGAFGASIAVHAALAAAFAWAPRPEPAQPAMTHIAVRSLTRELPEAAGLTPVPVAQAARQAVEPVPSGLAIAPALPDVQPAASVAPVSALATVAGGDVIAPSVDMKAVSRSVVAPETVAATNPVGVEAGITEGLPVIALLQASAVSGEVLRPSDAAVLPVAEMPKIAPSSQIAGLPASGNVAPSVLPGVAAVVPRTDVATSVPVVSPSAASGEGTLTVWAGAPASGVAVADERLAMLPVRPQRQNLTARPSVEPLQEVRNAIDRQSTQGGCFLALVTDFIGTIHVDGYADRGERLQGLDHDLAAVADASINMRRHRITAAQCEALTFARAADPTPLPRLTITSDTPELASGAEFSGTVHNLNRKRLSLLIVDDEGKVQELNDLSRNSDGSIGFRAPLTLTAGPVDTVQLVLAVASDAELATFAQRDGEFAASYFAALAAEIAAVGTPVEIGVAGFIVR